MRAIAAIRLHLKGLAERRAVSEGAALPGVGHQLQEAMTLCLAPRLHRRALHVPSRRRAATWRSVDTRRSREPPTRIAALRRVHPPLPTCDHNALTSHVTELDIDETAPLPSAMTPSARTRLPAGGEAVQPCPRSPPRQRHPSHRPSTRRWGRTELKQFVHETRFSRRSRRSQSHSSQLGHCETPQLLHGHHRVLPR